MNIKALIYSRYSTSVKIHNIIKQDSNKALCSDIDKLPQKSKALKARANERDKLKTPYGVWYVTHDDNDIGYAVCTSENYPERHAFGLIEKLQDKIREMKDSQYEPEENIKAHTKKLATQLCDRYNDLSKIDKLAQAQQQVESLKDEIGSGIKKIVGNQQSLNQMSEKAEKMKNYASQFQKNSEKLERMLYWRNCKLKIIAGIFIVAVLGFIILIIIQVTKSKTSN